MQSFKDKAASKAASLHASASDAAGSMKDKLKIRDAPYAEPGGKAATMRYGCAGAYPPEYESLDRLKSDLANSYYWTGSAISDYIFFVCQWHPWIGIIMSHPNHPWTKFERLMMTIISLGITIIPAAVIANTLDSEDVVAQASAKVLTICFVTLPNTIICVLLYQLAIADTKCPNCACLFQACLNGISCLAVASAALGTLIAYEIMSIESGGKVNWGEMTHPLLMGQLYSQAIWFPLWLVLPCQLGFISLWRYENDLAKAEAEAAADAGAGQSPVPAAE